MTHRLLPVFKKHIIVIILLIGLVITSSVTTGKLSTVTSVMAGLLMIGVGISLTYWIIRTPSKKRKEEVA